MEEKKYKKVAGFLKMSEEYYNTLTPREQWQLPYIIFGNILFMIGFFLLGSFLIFQGDVYTIVGILSMVSGFWFLVSLIMIAKENVFNGCFLSTIGILFAVLIILNLCPDSKTSLVYYRSGCFMAVMAICNEVMTLRRRQIYTFFIISMILWFVCVLQHLQAHLALTVTGTISGVGINTVAAIIVNSVVILMNKFSSRIITNAVNSESNALDNLTAITKVIAESQDGLEVGQRLYDETTKAENCMKELNEIYTGISRDANGLSQDTTTVTKSSSQVKEQAEKMKESVIKQNASINQTSGAIHTISDNLSQLSSIAEQRSANMTQMLETLESEKNLIRSIVEDVNNVKVSSEGVAGFVKTVDSIAEQTGLLAMNASIEAAHAGEKGKGFSVIAQEIRKLSEQTTRNAKQISDGLSKNTEMVASTTKSVASFDQYIQKTTEEMRSTIEMIEKILSGIQEIDIETGKVMKELGTVVQQSQETGTMVDSVVSEIDLQDKSLANISNFAEELRESVSGMNSQLNEIKGAIASIQQEAQNNISVTEKISSALEK